MNLKKKISNLKARFELSKVGSAKDVIVRQGKRAVTGAVRIHKQRMENIRASRKRELARLRTENEVIKQRMEIARLRRKTSKIRMPKRRRKYRAPNAKRQVQATRRQSPVGLWGWGGQ